MSDEQLCDVCGKPMTYDGDTAFYAGVRHWNCQYPDGHKSTEELFDDLRKAAGRVERSISQLRSKLK